MEKRNTVWDNVLRRAATDAAFRKSLKADPAKVLAEAGIAVSKSTEYVVVEQTPKKMYIVLPPVMEEGELSEAMLAGVAGGLGTTTLDLEEDDSEQQQKKSKH